MYLLAPTALRVAPDDFPARVRSRFASELRRAGSFAQLCLLGAQACLDAAGGDGPLGVLWASEFGALHATRAALDEDLRRGEFEAIQQTDDRRRFAAGNDERIDPR